MSIPECHSCHSGALPFAVRFVGGQWQHVCGAVVCPACGGVPAPGGLLCDLCDQLADTSGPGSLELAAADVVRGTRQGARPHGR